MTDPTQPESKPWHRPNADPTGDRNGFIQNIATLRGHIAILAAQVVALGGVPAAAPAVEQVPTRVRDAAIEQRLKLLDREQKILEQDLAEERRQRLRATEQLSEAKVTIDRLRREQGWEPTANPSAVTPDEAPADAPAEEPALEQRAAAPGPAAPAPAASPRRQTWTKTEPAVLRALRELGGEADAHAIAAHLGTTVNAVHQGVYHYGAGLVKRREGRRTTYRLPA